MTDNKFKNLPAGDVVDKLIDEWKTKKLEGDHTDENGVYEHRIFKGSYIMAVKNPETGETLGRALEVTSEKNIEDVLFLF